MVLEESKTKVALCAKNTHPQKQTASRGWYLLFLSKEDYILCGIPVRTRIGTKFGDMQISGSQWLMRANGLPSPYAPHILKVTETNEKKKKQKPPPAATKWLTLSTSTTTWPWDGGIRVEEIDQETTGHFNLWLPRTWTPGGGIRGDRWALNPVFL